MPDVKQIREELINGAKKALENYPKPDQRLISVRAVDLIAALDGSPTSTAGKNQEEKTTDR